MRQATYNPIKAKSSQFDADPNEKAQFLIARLHVGLVPRTDGEFCGDIVQIGATMGATRPRGARITKQNQSLI